MGIYIRLYTDFWSHRKTIKLKMAIGTDAYWIPPRLWSYAAENQLDGDFSGYTSEMLCDILGCSKHAPSMLQALHESGFLVNGKLNDWEEHNNFHAINSNRARKAAKARHEKERNKKEAKNKERDTETETETEQAGVKHAPSRNEPKNRDENREDDDLKEDKNLESKESSQIKESVLEIVDAWNLTVFNKCMKITPDRIKAIKLRLKDAFFCENWRNSLEMIKISSFCNGGGETGWRADFDWFIKPNTCVKIMEGKYSDAKCKNTSKPVNSTEFLKQFKTT